MDDEVVARTAVTGYLRTLGFDAVGLDGGEGLRREFDPDGVELVILDLLMPGEDGLALLRWLRSVSDVPVIMLTAAAATTDRVVGLEMGADDYLAKPCDLRELLARVRSVLRRRASAPAAPTPALAAARLGEPWFGRWRLERARRRLVGADGAAQPLSGAEFALLCAFADHPSVVLSRDRLLELSGTDPGEVFDRAIDLRILRLRRKIEPVPDEPSVIRTVRGHGGGYEYLPSEAPRPA